MANNKNMDLSQIFQSAINDKTIDFLANQIGEQDKDVVRAATNGIFSVLGNALVKESQNESALRSMVSAVDRDHDGSILDNIVGFLGGEVSPSNMNMLNGAGIIGHLLGGQKSNFIYDIIGKMTGLDKSKVGKLMILLAPVIMGAIGKVRNQGLRVDDISKVLRKEEEAQRKANPAWGVFGDILDTDNDGSVSDDLLNMGMRILLNKR